MSTDAVILISPTSNRTQEKDIHKVASFVDYATKKLGEKLYADFCVDVIEDVPGIFENRTAACSHVLGIALPDTEEYVNFQYSSFIPDDAVLLCAKCGKTFSLFRSSDEIKRAVPPYKRSDVKGVMCKTNGGKSAT